MIAPYGLLQLNENLANSELSRRMFASLDRLHKAGLMVDICAYVPVHGDKAEGENVDDILEGLFTKYNMNIPEDFKGHSMSVSDLVLLKVDGAWRAYYTDTFGFADVTDEKPVKEFLTRFC